MEKCSFKKTFYFSLFSLPDAHWEVAVKPWDIPYSEELGNEALKLYISLSSKIQFNELTPEQNHIDSVKQIHLIFSKSGNI